MNRWIVVDEEISDITFGGTIKALYRQASSLRDELELRHSSKVPIFRSHDEDPIKVNISSIIPCFPELSRLAASQSK